jgi:aspartyl/asparaginyl beta-hydroxylase (cupin superfamily)
MGKFDSFELLNDMILKFEDWGWFNRTPAFIHDYEEMYPHFKKLEENHAIVQEECKALFKHYSELKDIKGMAGAETEAGIHTLKWKSFMFKSGVFIEENCELCPKTAEILKGIPDIYTAFFSILEPQQHITPHQGYFQGFLRYHMGIIIPDNNKHKKCWLRINGDFEDNQNKDKSSIEKGEVYHWKNGEGIIFNDNYMHDAANFTDEIRVILWIDVLRKFPKPVEWFLKSLLFVALKTPQAKAIARQNKVTFSDKM